MTCEITTVLLAHARRGRAAMLGSGLTELVDGLRAEPGCVSCELDLRQDGVWFVSTQWGGDEALTNNLTSPLWNDLLLRLQPDVACLEFMRH